MDYKYSYDSIEVSNQPSVKICNAYYKSKRKDGYVWAHFPLCNDANCPLTHKELLCGASLEN